MLEKVATLFHQGGEAVMSSIAFVLLISIVIIIERVYRYWLQYDLPNSTGYMSAIQKMVMNNSIENAIRLCKKAKPKLLPYVLSEALKRANDSTQEIENAMEHAFLSVVPKATKGVAFLSTTANVCNIIRIIRNDIWLDEVFWSRGFRYWSTEANNFGRGYRRSFDCNLVWSRDCFVVSDGLRGIDDEADSNCQ